MTLVLGCCVPFILWKLMRLEQGVEKAQEEAQGAFQRANAAYKGADEIDQVLERFLDVAGVERSLVDGSTGPNGGEVVREEESVRNGPVFFGRK
jgi:hypothetical protein